MNTVGIVYPSIVVVGCFSHTLDIVGEKFDTPNLGHCGYLFSHSHKVKSLWKEQTGRAMANFSKTRWWSRWEVLHQVLQQFGDVVLFLNTNTDISPATYLIQLLEIFSDVH